MSIANFKRSFWIPALKTRVTMCLNYLGKKNKSDKFNVNLATIKTELIKENKYIIHLINTIDEFKNQSIKKELANKFPKIKLNSYRQSLLESNRILTTNFTFDKKTAKKINFTLNQIKSFYTKYYNTHSKIKNIIISQLQKQENGKALFLEKRDNNQNESLSDLVKNNNELNKIIEYNGSLIQKSDPIYRDSEGIRAHFFAPTKKIFNKKIDTFWVNIIIIIIMSLALFITLYLDLLKKLIDRIGEISTKIGLSKEQ
jgi:hypothetical protein